MSSRTLEATAVHTVTVAAAKSAEPRTVARDVRDVFDALTRVVDVSPARPSDLSPETWPEKQHTEEGVATTGERTQLWTRPEPNNASTAAFAPTQLLAVTPLAPVPSLGGRSRLSRVVKTALCCLVALAAALGSYGAIDRFGRGGAAVATAAAVVRSPGAAEVREEAASTRPSLSEQDLAALEAAAADALLSGKPMVALPRYRELAARDGGEVFSRVAKILEHAP